MAVGYFIMSQQSALQLSQPDPSRWALGLFLFFTVVNSTLWDSDHFGGINALTPPLFERLLSARSCVGLCEPDGWGGSMVLAL